MTDANRMQGIFKVQNHNLLLLGSEPSTDCTHTYRSSLRRCSLSKTDTNGGFPAERNNPKTVDTKRRQGVLKVQNHNLLLLGSEPSTDCTKVYNSSLRGGSKITEGNVMQDVFEVQN